MLLLSNPKIQDLFIKEKIFDKKQIEDFIVNYSFAILDLIIDEIQIYIEQNNLTNVDEYLRSIADEIKKKKRSTIDDQLKFYTEIFNVLNDYPALKDVLKKETQKFDDDLNEILLEGLDDSTYMKFMEIIESDLKELEKEEAAAKRLMASPDYNKV